MKKKTLLAIIESAPDNTDFAVFDIRHNQHSKINTRNTNLDGVYKNFEVIPEKTTDHNLADHQFDAPMYLIQFQGKNPIPIFKPISQNPEHDCTVLLRVKIQEKYSFVVCEFFGRGTVGIYSNGDSFFFDAQTLAFSLIKNISMPSSLKLAAAMSAHAEWVEIDQNGFLI